jgi:hypothetical protein
MPSGAFGPFDPDDPELEKKMREAMSVVERFEGEKIDKSKMIAEARMVGLKHFVEGLEDQQLRFMRELVGGLAVQGKDNYMTSTLYGILLGAEWGRVGIEPVPEFAALDDMMGQAHIIEPVERDEDLPPQDAA